jgi:hypothetical protein
MEGDKQGEGGGIGGGKLSKTQDARGGGRGDTTEEAAAQRSQPFMLLNIITLMKSVQVTHPHAPRSSSSAFF